MNFGLILRTSVASFRASFSLPQEPIDGGRNDVGIQIVRLSLESLLARRDGFLAISRLKINQCQILNVNVGSNRFQAQCLPDHRNGLLRFSGVPENHRQVNNSPDPNWDRAPRLAPPRRSLRHSARSTSKARPTCCAHRPASHSWPGPFASIRWPSLWTPWDGSFRDTRRSCGSHPTTRRRPRTRDPARSFPPPCDGPWHLALPIPLEQILAALHEFQVGVEILRAFRPHPGLLADGQIHRQRRRDLQDDLVLKGEDLLQIPIEGSAQRCCPEIASINWALIRTLSPNFWTLPSSTYRTPSSLLTFRTFTGFPL